MSDIVERLRACCERANGINCHDAYGAHAEPHDMCERCHAAAEIERLRAQRDALAGTLRYLLAQAKNGTLHPQVVIQNAESALAAAAAVAEALGGKDGENNA